MIIVVAARPLATIVRRNDFERQQFVMREEGSATRQHIEQYLRRRGLSVRTAMTVGSPEAVKRYVATGIGWGFASKQSVLAEIANGRLAIVDVDGWELFSDVLRCL